jgi:hypothetical protein
MIDIRELNDAALSEAFGTHIVKLFSVLVGGENFQNGDKFDEAIVRFMRGYNNAVKALRAVHAEIDEITEDSKEPGVD